MASGCGYPRLEHRLSQAIGTMTILYEAAPDRLNSGVLSTRARGPPITASLELPHRPNMVADQDVQHTTIQSQELRHQEV